VKPGANQIKSNQIKCQEQMHFLMLIFDGSLMHSIPADMDSGEDARNIWCSS
jgi:hypothetical protein